MEGTTAPPSPRPPCRSPGSDSGLTVPVLLLWAGTEETQLKPAKFPWLLGPRAPKPQGGDVARGVVGHRATSLRPSPPFPRSHQGGDTLTLRMLLAAPGGRGAEGTRRCEHHGPPRSGRAGLAGLRGDSGCGGRDCVSNRSHSALLAFGSRLSLEFSSDPGRSRSPVPRGSGAQREKVPAKRGAGAGAECARE